MLANFAQGLTTGIFQFKSGGMPSAMAIGDLDDRHLELRLLDVARDLTASLWIACYRANDRFADYRFGIFAFVSSGISIVVTLVAWSFYFAARLYPELPP